VTIGTMLVTVLAIRGAFI